MTSDQAAAMIAATRRVMAAKRAELCRHGVAICHDCERQRKEPTRVVEAAETDTTPDPRAAVARAALKEDA